MKYEELVKLAKYQFNVFENKTSLEKIELSEDSYNELIEDACIKFFGNKDSLDKFLNSNTVKIHHDYGFTEIKNLNRKIIELNKIK